MDGETSERVVGDDDRTDREPDDDRTTTQLPAEPAPVWRTCETDDDCELKVSACLPLETGGLPVCRRLRALDGADCDSPDDCELGMVCGPDGADVRTCRAWDARGGPCGTASWCTRLPLSCDPDGARTRDADCEIE
jgi:hypothetical protein